MSDTVSVFSNIVASIEREVSEFNETHGPRLTASRIGNGVQVVPKVASIVHPHPLGPVVVAIDGNTKVIQFDGTIASPGVPRRDFFTINPEGLVVLKEHMVGSPEPQRKLMTPEHFSKFVLAEMFAKTA
jgi:hypothetical protein